jgi:serine/threonine protein kinase
MAEDQDKLIGQKINQYEIQSVAGRGENSTVYRGLQAGVNRNVAIKMYNPDLMRQPNFMARFAAEVNLLAHLEHFNIVSIYEAGEWQGTPYVVTRFMPGGSLDDMIARLNRIPIEVVVPMIRQAAAALDYAHLQNILHRDLRPSNVLLDAQGNAYLSDFGVGRVIESATSANATGQFGSAAYMAPEMAAGSSSTTATDIYALAVIIYEALTGQVPFKAETPVKQMMLHLNQPVPAPRTINSAIPIPVEGVLLRALAKKPEDRYPTATALADALSMAAGFSPSGVTAPHPAARPDNAPTYQGARTPAKPHSRPARSSLETYLFYGVAGLLVLGIVALGGYLATSFLGDYLAGNLTGDQTPVITDAPATVTSDPGAAEASPTESLPTETGGPPAPTVAASGAPGGGSGVVAFISDRDGEPEVFIYDLQTRDLIKVTQNNFNDSSPVWSPGGKYLAFRSEPRTTVPNITVVDAAGQNAQVVSGNLRAGDRPVWISADTVAFYVEDGSDRLIYKVTIGGQPEEMLRLPASVQTLLDWTPDGSTGIYFGYTATGGFAVVGFDAASGDRTPLSVSGNIPFASYSPDRSMVAFTFRVGSQLQLFLADATCPFFDQCNARRLITDDFNYEYPRFSPDGKLIMVTSNQGGRQDLLLVDLDGNLVEKMSGSSGLADYDGTWKP